MGFIEFSFIDFLDIILVAFLLYQLYLLIRNTVAMNVLIGVAAIYVVWKLVEALQMELLSEILGTFIGVGVIAVVIVFQQEIRKFLLVIGSTGFTTRKRNLLRRFRWAQEKDNSPKIEAIVKACISLSTTKTGALIVIENEGKLGSYISTGTMINADTSENLLESIFNKTSPLHDGAVILRGQNIVAAGCILPVTEKSSLPSRFGLRHRAALGVVEKTNAIAIVVSEETGGISFIVSDQFDNMLSPEALGDKLREHFKQDVN